MKTTLNPLSYSHSLLLLVRAFEVFAQSSSSSSTTSSTSTSISTTTNTLVSAAIPSPTAPLDSPLPSQVAVPPKQGWCPSAIFCAGELLQTINLAHLYPDDKTFVDKPTREPAQTVLRTFHNLSLSGPTTYRQIVDFVQTHFGAEGQELLPLPLPSDSFAGDESPRFLKGVKEDLPRAFAKTVHGFWGQLVRRVDESDICPLARLPSQTSTLRDDSTQREEVEETKEEEKEKKCESTLIPLPHPFVVPGGRFREQYYWDSYWILEGLLVSELYETAKDTLRNFMFEIERFGVIPNGGRIYYLSRSQPPLFIQMLARYVEVTGDRSLLKRALPLAEKELSWFRTHRSRSQKSPYTNTTHDPVYFYSSNSTAPRPESYRTDYLTANDPTPGAPQLTESQKSELYTELAAGAESGWDYTARWFAAGREEEGLRSLNIRNTLAVDLNSIIYRNHVLMSSLYPANSSSAARHRKAAEELRATILDLFWDAEKFAFYDFTSNTNTRSTFFSVAHFYPFWSGIVPPELLRSPANAFRAFSSVHLVLNRYNGTYPTTLVDTGLQWDAPNAWPCHQQVVLGALRNLPASVAEGALYSFLGEGEGEGKSSFDLVPPNQLGLKESELPGQPVYAGGNASVSGVEADINAVKGNGTVNVVNGGDVVRGEGWAAALGRQLANRYFASAFCSWHATGGEIPDILPRLPDDQLNVTQSVNGTGNMFEKFSMLDIDSAGRGGEYVVQAGFGWTNGVLLWVASRYGAVLKSPECPSLLEVPTAPAPDLSTTIAMASSTGSALGGGVSASAGPGTGGAAAVSPPALAILAILIFAIGLAR